MDTVVDYVGWRYEDEAFDWRAYAATLPAELSTPSFAFCFQSFQNREFDKSLFHRGTSAPVDLSKLNGEQRTLHDLLLNHRRRSLFDSSQPAPLRLIIQGSAGE